MKKDCQSLVKERLNTILREKFNRKVVELSRAIDFPSNLAARYINGTVKVSLEFIVAILDKCPDISPSWLLLGKEAPKTHIELSSNLGSGTIQDRLNYIVSKECDGNISELARKIGIRQSTISPYFKDKTPSLEFLMAIFKNFPYVTADWLLLGLDDKRKVVYENNNDSLISMANTVAELTRELIECRKKIAELKEQIYKKKSI